MRPLLLLSMQQACAPVSVTNMFGLKTTLDQIAAFF